MKKTVFVLAALLIVSVVLSGCSDDDMELVEKGGSDASGTAEGADSGEGGNAGDDGSDADGGVMKSSIKQLMGMGKSVRCEYTINDPEIEGGKYTQTMYLSGEKFRSDGKIFQDGKEHEVHTISDGEWMYSWNSMSEMAVKVRLDEAESGEAGYEGDESMTEAMTAEYEFRCSPWAADNSKFVPPSNIKFMDINRMMQDLQSNPDDMCASCEMIPDGAEKANCMESLGC